LCFLFVSLTRMRVAFGASAERFTAPEEVALLFECLCLLVARVADCAWAAGV
jgi:hypothetical protein